MTTHNCLDTTSQAILTTPIIVADEPMKQEKELQMNRHGEEGSVADCVADEAEAIDEGGDVGA